MVMEDGAAIAELEYSLFRDAWSEKSILETLKQPNAICLIAEKADRTAGYLLAYTAAEEMEIARIGVVKEMRRQGVARELLGALEKIGKQSGIEKILLDVRSGNERHTNYIQAKDLRKTGSESIFILTLMKMRF